MMIEAWFDIDKDVTGEESFNMSTEGHILEKEEMEEPKEKAFEKRTKKDKVKIPRQFPSLRQVYLRKFRGQR